MIQRGANRMSMRALVVDDELGTPTAEGRAVRALVEEMQGRSIEVVEATSAEDGTSVITSDSAIHAVLIDWTLGDDKITTRAHTFIEVRCARATTRSRSSSWPSDGEATDIPIDVMEMVDEFIWTLEDTAAFVGGRVAGVHPPLPRSDDAAAGRGDDAVHAGVRVLLAHARATPAAPRSSSRRSGACSSTSTARTCCARTCRSASGSLGSLLDHSGPMGEHERYAARVFGAHRTLQRHQRHLDVEPRDLHGRGGSRPDRAVRSQLPQVDRAQPGHDGRHPATTWCRCAIATESSARSRRSACTKEAHQGLDQGQSAGDEGREHARPCTPSSRTPPTTAFATTRSACRNCSIRASIASISTKPGTRTRASIRSIATATRCMAIPKDHKGPTIFATHSTHKLLAALSQASFLHIRDGRSADPAFALQRIVHDAGVDLAAVSHHRLERHHRRDDGRPGRPHAHRRIDRGGGGLPADRGPRAPAVREEEANGSSRPGTRRPSRRRRAARRSASKTPSRSSSPPIRSAGCCIRAKPGTASAISKTTTACSIRSRCRSSRRAWRTREASTSAAFPRRW